MIASVSGVLVWGGFRANRGRTALRVMQADFSVKRKVAGGAHVQIQAPGARRLRSRIVALGGIDGVEFVEYVRNRE